MPDLSGTTSSRISDLIHVWPTHRIRRAVVRISLRSVIGVHLRTDRRYGRGIFPNYKIEEPSVPVTVSVLSHQFGMTATPAHTFSGRNHREMTELDDHEWHDENWSTDTLSSC